MNRWRTGLRWLLALIYAGVGIVHLRNPEGFLPIMPDWVPWPREVILLTGCWELAGALLLAWPSPRLNRIGGLAMAAYAVAVFPANIKHALDSVEIAGQTLGWSYHAPRLAFQPVFVWWALWATHIIDWPWSQGRGRPAP
ncbi:DoxX family protein [Polymorphobacter sp.]|uniref:DoxX family protein n=1 Tax=Polymorphobacter sp. TaxID=1909290 RepID=UPI003F6F5503